MTGLGRSRSSITVCSLPLYCLVTFRPKIMVIFLGWPIVRFNIQQALREFIHGGAPEEDQIVAVLHLREEQPVLAAGLMTFLGGEEGSAGRQPLLPALQQIPRRQGIGQLLQPFRIRAPQEGVLALLKIYLLLSHPNRQPMMLV